MEVVREDDANKTSGDDGLALSGSLVGESKLRIPKLEPDIIFSNRVPLVSVELEWCALKSPSIRVSVVIIRWFREGRYPPAQELTGGYVDVGNNQLRVSQGGRNSQLLQMRFYQSI